MHIFPPNINSSHRADLPEEILVILPELEAEFCLGIKRIAAWLLFST
jgi:hypothetical protein